MLTLRKEAPGARKIARYSRNGNFAILKLGMSHDESLIIHPAKRLAGSVRLPGDKSISHRYAMLAAIAEGTTYLKNFSAGADCASTLRCLQAVGVDLQQNEKTVVIHGRGAKLLPPDLRLDCGNSGST